MTFIQKKAGLLRFDFEIISNSTALSQRFYSYFPNAIPTCNGVCPSCNSAYFNLLEASATSHFIATASRNGYTSAESGCSIGVVLATFVERARLFSVCERQSEIGRPFPETVLWDSQRPLKPLRHIRISSASSFRVSGIFFRQEAHRIYV